MATEYCDFSLFPSDPASLAGRHLHVTNAALSCWEDQGLSWALLTTDQKGAGVFRRL